MLNPGIIRVTLNTPRGVFALAYIGFVAFLIVWCLAAKNDVAAFNCDVVGETGEGFPVAECADGTRWYQDMDGQIYENAPGYPVYEPGTWVPYAAEYPVF